MKTYFLCLSVNPRWSSERMRISSTTQWQKASGWMSLQLHKPPTDISTYCNGIKVNQKDPLCLCCRTLCLARTLTLTSYEIYTPKTRVWESCVCSTCSFRCPVVYCIKLRYSTFPEQGDDPSVYSLHSRQRIRLPFEGILRVNSGHIPKKEREAAIEGSNH